MKKFQEYNNPTFESKPLTTRDILVESVAVEDKRCWRCKHYNDGTLYSYCELLSIGHTIPVRVSGDGTCDAFEAKPEGPNKKTLNYRKKQ